jgi:hypothetical protein
MKKLFFLSLICYFNGFYSQNALVGTGFAAGWGWGCNQNHQFSYFGSSAGTSFILTKNGNGTGDQYFRLGIDFSGTVAQNTINVGSDVQLSLGTEYNLNSTCTTSGAMFLNVSSTAHNYVFKTENAGTNPSRKLIVFCVQGAVATINSVSRNFNAVAASQSPTISATLSAPLNTGQGIYLRYTTDNFATSTIVEMTGAASTYSASIPSFASGTNVKYYVFSSGNGLTINHSKADWYTINLNSNSGSNYSYTVSPTQYQAVNSGNWSSLSNWQSGNGTDWSAAASLPTNTSGSIKVNSGVTISLDNSITLNSLENNGVLNANDKTITIANNGSFTNNGTFNAGTGSLIFSGNNSVSGTVSFNTVQVNGNLALPNSITINGELILNTSAYLSGFAPFYGASSKLKYNSGGNYSRNLEWSAASGAGFPNDVQISNNTSLDLPNSSLNVSSSYSISRDLIIDANSAFYMDFGAGSNSGSLIIGRNLSIAGNFSFGDGEGGDVILKGNWLHSTGTINFNNRALLLTGTTNQTIGNPSTETFQFLIVNKSNGLVQLNTNVIVNSKLTLTAGNIELNSSNLTIGQSAIIEGYSASSYISTNSTGKLIQNGITSGSTAGKTFFPIGHGSTYSPCIINNSGTMDDFSVSVNNTLLSNGTSGTSLSANNVNKTWFIDEAIIGNSNVNLTVFWNVLDEASSFSNQSAYISHYQSGSWDNFSNAVATNSNGLYQLSRAGIVSFSPFGVFGSSNLPVELIEFKATCTDEESVEVNWSTASEFNASHFILKHSRDALYWTDLNQQQAAGNSTETQFYKYTENGIDNEINYYLLEQHDVNGQVKKYGPISLMCSLTDNEIGFYPNPTNGNLCIKNLNDLTTNFSVYDLNGIRLYTNFLAPNSVNNLELGIKDGTYVIEFIGENGEKTSKILQIIQ